MNENDQQEKGQQKGVGDHSEPKGSGHRGDQGQQSHDTSRLERDGHEFPRTGDAQQSNNPQNQQKELSREAGGYGRDTGQPQGQSAQHQGMEENDSLGQHEGNFDDAGQGDPLKQKQAPVGSTNPPERHDSWRPTADPAAGDLATDKNLGDATE